MGQELPEFVAPEPRVPGRKSRKPGFGSRTRMWTEREPIDLQQCNVLCISFSANSNFESCRRLWQFQVCLR